MDARSFYDGMGSDYDLMVSWEARLEREAAFLGKIRKEVRASSVLDAACGTGMHAIAFARQGLRCAGADLSPEMIAQARRNAGEAGVDVDLRVAGFGDLARTYANTRSASTPYASRRVRLPPEGGTRSASTPYSGTFDLVTCLGNSLPHLLDDQSLDRALEDFARVLAPGGLLVIQNRNYDRVVAQKIRFMPVSAKTDGAEETLFLRITDFRDGTDVIDFTIVTLRKKDGAWSQSVRTTPLRALSRRTLEDALGRCGFTRMRAWGGYDMSPFDEVASPDLLVAAARG